MKETTDIKENDVKKTKDKEKEVKKGGLSLNTLLIIQLVLIVALSLAMTKTVGASTRKNSINHMMTITNERADIIMNYVRSAEKTLTYYSKAGQITDLLASPTNESAVSKAQAYTEDYSADIENLEGIYASEWNTHVLTHTSRDVVGMTTRKEEASLKQLQDAMLAAGNGVYDTGFIISPASGQQIISMYKAVYGKEGSPVGLVGLGIYTDQLVNVLDSLEIKGVEDSSYTMMNVSDSKYIFANDKSLIGATATTKRLTKLCEQFKGTNDVAEGTFIYKNADGKNIVSTYRYIPEYGWLLFLDAPKSQVYSLTNNLRGFMVVFAVIIIAMAIIFSRIAKRQQKADQKLASTIVKNNKTKESLYTAMFKDVLTDVNNRISFSMEMDNHAANDANPWYYAIFNISDFSAVNSKYGNDTGDWLLVKTVETLKQVFKTSTIYRTGSDEFVVVLNGGSPDNKEQNVADNMAEAMSRLTERQTTPVGKATFRFRAGYVKKTGKVNTSIITILKDMITTNTGAAAGQIIYNDLDR